MLLTELLSTCGDIHVKKYSHKVASAMIGTTYNKLLIRPEVIFNSCERLAVRTEGFKLFFYCSAEPSSGYVCWCSGVVLCTVFIYYFFEVKRRLNYYKLAVTHLIFNCRPKTFIIGAMNNFIVIRDYKPGDEVQCHEIVKEGAMSTVNNAFFSLIEITFQFMVLTTAVMFIFFQFPFTICLCSIPIVVVFMYFCIWSGHLFKAIELTQDLINIPRVYMSSKATGFWVAEAFEPFFMEKDPKHFKYHIFTENDFKHKNIDTKSYRKSLVGTVGITKSLTTEDNAWLRRMAVKPKYQRMGIAKALLNEALQFCCDKDYQGIELVTSEWHDNARNLYVKKGFHLKQMYHKQLLSSIVTVLIYQLYFKIQPKKLSITP